MCVYHIMYIYIHIYTYIHIITLLHRLRLRCTYRLYCRLYCFSFSTWEAECSDQEVQRWTKHGDTLQRLGFLLPLVSREWKNGRNSSFNCTPFLHSLLTKGRFYLSGFFGACPLSLERFGGVWATGVVQGVERLQHGVYTRFAEIH